MFDFCGIGNSCIDIVASADDDFLRQWAFPKSICTYLTLEQADALEAALPSLRYIPGGCAANTASVIIALGGSASFIGRVANDKIGRMLIDDFKRRNIHYPCIPVTDAGAGSTRVFALITPDTERTFASYYGVQEDLSVADLDEHAIAYSKFMYLDGYALNAKNSADAFLKAADIAHKNGRKVVFSPSDISILTKYADAVRQIEKVSDIILCSEQEAAFMTGEPDLKKAVEDLKKRYSAGAVTNGANGVYVFDATGISCVPAAIPPANVIDTNGAGDAFAAGFLYGLAQGMTMESAGALGNICAAHMITHAGARPMHDYKAFLKEVPEENDK